MDVQWRNSTSDLDLLAEGQTQSGLECRGDRTCKHTGISTARSNANMEWERGCKEAAKEAAKEG
jgi:hypothetical protein